LLVAGCWLLVAGCWLLVGKAGLCVFIVILIRNDAVENQELLHHAKMVSPRLTA
jgi:hypothetical protein